MSGGLLALVLASLLAAARAGAAPLQLVIHNGSAPPDPENVIDADYDPFLWDVFVRNVGCGDSFPFDAPCAAPGAPTRVAVVEGGVVNSLLAVFDTSALEMSGGTTLRLGAYGSSVLALGGGTVTNELEAAGTASVSITQGRVEQFLTPRENSRVYLEGGTIARINAAGWSRTAIRAGTVTGHVAADGFAVVRMSGGSVGSFLAGFYAGTVELRGGSVAGELSTNGELVAASWSGGAVGGALVADGGSTIRIRGSGFAVDGLPVPDGPLPGQQGLACGTQVLSGTLASGEPFANDFGHDGCFDAQLGRELTGTIVVPEASASCLGSAALLALLALRGSRQARARLPAARIWRSQVRSACRRSSPRLD
jgi:hypothetical protein